ncbi:MAG: cytochrome c biogenesis protein CcsA [Candidatus Omnitrophica bacterium]|nr:cytochrome c biogenesis protein CcsA [Candidatus Omnitrophota bacterium]
MKYPLAPLAWCAAALLLPLSSAAAEKESAPALPRISQATLQALRLLPIQHHGRHKPFDSFARETLQLITGSPRLGTRDPVETILAIMAEPEHWQAQPLVSVPFIPLREALGLDRQASQVSYNDLVATRTLMRMLPAIVEKQRRDEKLSMLEQETMDVFDRFATFSNLVEHRLELVPSQSVSDWNWRSIQQPEGYPPQKQAEIRQAWAGWVTALREGDAASVDAATTRLLSTLQGLNPAALPPTWKLRLEVFYNQAHLFRIAQLGYWLAAVLFLIALLRSAATAIRAERSAERGGRSAAVAGVGGAAFAAFALSAALHVGGIILRVVIGGRPPVSNFFETMLWIPLVGVLLAFIFERIYRARYFAFSTALLAAVTLLLSEYVPLDSSISPVVAVLRSNLWLTIHVLTIVASYGALALATVLAHVYGVVYLARSPAAAALESLGTFLYRAIQVGVVLLAGGIMLGAVWANASWGRYWGWDPKETWALITLLWFIAILHGRFAGWLTGVGVALSTIGGFFLRLMTYYGVSFYLVGLHSYAGGHAKPLPPLLIAYLILELSFLILVGVVAMNRRRVA